MAKKYHVYGMGNALVDMEYKVEISDLRALNLEKGVMTLVDQEQQIKIMDYLSAHHCQRGSGGSAANSLIAISQFGGTAFYSCKVAQDDLGHFYIKELIDGGVATGPDTGQGQGHGLTGRCVVLVTPDSDRTLCTFLGVSSALSLHELVVDALCDSDYFYTEGYLVTSDTARQASIEAKKRAEAAGVKTAISLSDPNMVNFFKAGLLEMIGSGVDLVFANEDEALGMAETDSLSHAADYLRTISQAFVITRGPKGALVWDGQASIDIAPVEVKAVDTLGAGDMFAGAFLYGLTQGWNHRRAADLASAASAKLVTRFGPRMTAMEVQAILRDFIAQTL